MPRTRRWNFLVTDTKHEDYLSLKVIGNGCDGEIVKIPKQHQEYTEDIMGCLCSELDRGTILEAELISDPEAPDDWRIKQVVDHRRP